MAERPIITPDILRQLLRYEPDTGKLFWLPRGIEWFTNTARKPAEEARKVWNKRFADNEALASLMKSGYLHGSIFAKRHYAHVTAWTVYYGRFPDNEIDHEDHNRSNNKIDNLRDVSDEDQCRNLSMLSTNTSGRVGVSFDKRRSVWSAYIGANNRKISLGNFNTFDEACAARTAEEERLGYHQNHGTSGQALTVTRHDTTP